MAIKSMLQNNILILTLILMSIILITFLFVALNASSDGGDYTPIQKKAYGIRAKFFAVLLIAGIIISITTTLQLPYAATRGITQDVDKQIDVMAYQWYWELSESSVKVGESVVFNVRSADVTHGLGIYDEDMRLIAQTQAMPDYSNHLKVTFDKPGKYKLLCMEYCGLAHHKMISEFHVLTQ